MKDFNNQIEQANFIKEKFSTYLRSAFDIRYQPYSQLYNARLSELESRLYKGPYLASALPFEQSLSIRQLIEKGVFEEDFSNIGEVDLNRPCYSHQIKAFERIKAGRSIVVTTGTGSGKTECFMYPIINSILEEINNGNNQPGIRAIFLFPLNALVYDQIDRLRTYLQKFTNINYGFYTGKTPDNKRTKEYREQKAYLESLPKHELVTREQMKENPPHILFTNYSMLEYLLIRPSDERLISKEALKNLKFIVMDEAHTYRGALGIEISLLLRRLTGLADHSLQFVLTSATLGRGYEDIGKIKEFAHTLTSNDYENADIVFGIRQANSFGDKYSIAPDDYEVLLENLENLDQIKTIFSKYRKYDDQATIYVNLYTLLRDDKNTHELYCKTCNVGDIKDVKNYLFDFSYSNIAALVELIAKARSNDSNYYSKLFDIKYHMFMKAPDGAFVTIGKQKDLSLITTNRIGKDKAFKIGICQNCKVPYIMGITENNYLCVDDEIDIDESYADKAKRMEYYLIEETLTPEEIEDLNNNKSFEKYNICPTCGYIKKATAIPMPTDCEHFNEKKVVLYKYVGGEEKDLDDDDVVTNNIHRCPVCEYRSNGGGVIMGFHVGKDRATALISQILYESMRYPIQKEKVPASLFAPEHYKEKKGKKQYLVFSDSRQQAAFFSKFINSNNDRFLKKALLLEVLKENGNQTITYLSLIEKLEDKFRNKLHYSEENAKKHAKATVLWELLLVDGRNSGEGLGLYAFKLDLDRGAFTDEDNLNNGLRSLGYDLTAQQFKDIMSQVFAIFRTAPAIEFGSIPFCDNLEEKKELLGYRHLSMCIKKQKARDDKPEDFTFDPVKSFIPVREAFKNNAVKYIMNALNYSLERAKELLHLIFDAAVEQGVLIQNHESEQHDAYLIDAKSYKFYSYQNLTFYKCKKCHKITLYNVNNTCVEGDCGGELEYCDVEKDPFLQNNYYRNEYINRPIETIECEEHTAQINSNAAKNIQERFKNGGINIISCSTTFEMGIDLGGLNTVFMRNVPPMPSNYAQRAGRAGRRAETSAFILTFCGSSSHDYTYFNEPPKMIRGLVSPPYFVIDNEKIIMRHIMATALSCYFREPKYQEDFASVSHFLEEGVATKIMEYIKSKPNYLGQIIDKYVLKDDALLREYGDFKWIDKLIASESSILKMREGLKNLTKTYQDAERYARDNRDYALAGSYQTALKRLDTSNSLISAFTEYNVIPGYGFPVDNVELHIYNYEKLAMDETYNLSRNLSIAISEYAPGSEIIVDNKKYTSRYLMLPYNGHALPAKYYVECEKCHTINTHIDKHYFSPGCKCKYCDTQLNVVGTVKSYVTPIYGFVADRQNKNTRRVKPFKTYASDVYYVGTGLKETDDFRVISVQEHVDEELLVLNENKFFYCRNCGYTVLDKKQLGETKAEDHRQYNGRKCDCGSNLQLIHLGYSYKTDIIQINFNRMEEMKDYDTALSVLYAILEGISTAYNIERNDIGGMLYSINPAKPYCLLLYDTVSGGAGHVKRLKNSQGLIEVLKAALVKVSQDCCSEDVSCYNCLRTYNNQRLHKHIKRGLAKAALKTMIERIMEEKEKFTVSEPDFEFPTNDIQDFVNNSGYLEGSEDLVNRLLHEINTLRVAIPNGYGYIVTGNESKQSYNVDFIWNKEKIMLFTIANQDSFEYLSSNQNEYECFLLTESLDCVKFAQKLEN